jgi:glycosyltransferase involved in cell wall biosynthesis
VRVHQVVRRTRRTTFGDPSRTERRPPAPPATLRPSAGPPVVHQVLSGAGPYDAVTRQALAWRERFRAWGWDGGDWAPFIDPRVGRRVRDVRGLRLERGDTLLLHYSAYAPRLESLLDGPWRKVLLSHNVTPARWYWDHDPNTAIQCALGRWQLPEFAERCDAVAGVSAYNAAELGTDRVVPLLVDLRPGPVGEPGGPATLLFVGRLAPHKRQDEAIRVLALLRRHRLADARLVLVGEPLTPRYAAALEELGDRLAPGAVRFERSLDDAALADRYRAAHAFLCLSEHEGFCLPLLEAFAHGVPVVARPRGAVPETVGDAALLLDGSLDAMAELAHFAVVDAQLRATLRERGRERLEAYAPRGAEAAMRELLAG